MEELVYLKRDEPLTDSLIVAEVFGKRHDRVLRAIDNLLKNADGRRHGWKRQRQEKR